MWAYPDVSANNSKLAVTGLQNQDALYRLKAILITSLITDLIGKSNLSDIRLRDIKELIESNPGDNALKGIALKTIYGTKKGIRELRLRFDNEGLIVRFFNPDYPAVEKIPYPYIDITEKILQTASHDLFPDRETNIQTQVLRRIINEDRRDLMHRLDKKAGKNNGFSTSEMDSAIWDEVIPPDDNTELIKYHRGKARSANNQEVPLDNPKEKPTESTAYKHFYKAESVYKDYFETVFEFNIRLFVLLARRMKAKRLSDQAVSEKTKSDIAVRHVG